MTTPPQWVNRFNEREREGRRQKLLDALRDEHGGRTPDMHFAHDEALLDYINDPEVTEAFNAHEKWYE